MEVWVNPSDELRIITNASVAVTIDVTARIRQPETQGVNNNNFPSGDPPVMVVTINHTSSNDRAPTSTTVDVGFEGLMDSCTATVAADSANTPRRGQCYVRLGLVRGTSIVPIANGYINGIDALMMSESEDSLSGKGYFHRVDGTDPAAGADMSEAIPTNAIWKLRAMRLKFTTDANVANRRMRLRFATAGGDWLNIVSGADQAASGVWYYNWFSGANKETTALVGNNLDTYIPDDIYLDDTLTIATAINNIQVGDQVENILMWVEEWIQE